MAGPGYTLKVKPLELLSAEQVRDTQRAILQVLWETGVRIESEWALDFLAKHDCVVDREEQRVRFPAEVVVACLEKAPRTFHLRARDPKHDLEMGGDNLHFSHGSGMHTIDPRTFEPRPPSRAEYVDCIRVLDALPSISCLGCYPYFGYDGVPPVLAIPSGVALKMQYSTKHQTACYSQGSEIWNIQMAQALGIEISGAATSSAPLTWGGEAVDCARRMAEAGFAIITIDGCIMGATGPATVPGSVVVSSAEHMAMLVLLQLLNPGQRMIIGHFSVPLNMATGAPAFGAIGASLNNAIFNQVWRSYGLPCGNGSPAYVAAKTIDFQAGYEKGMAGLVAALSGANHLLLHFAVSAEISAHPLQAVLDDDVAGMIGRFIAGEEVSEETLAVDLIDQVGPIPGHYLNTAHTRKWWKREQFLPRAADRLTYAEWIAQGKKTAIDLARARVDDIVATHQPSPLTPDQEADLERILREAKMFYRQKGQI